MGAHTHREYQAWMAWLYGQWNAPSRTDHYLMLVAAEIRRILLSFRKGSKLVRLDELKIKFSEQVPLTPEERAAHSKRTWMAALGLKDGRN